MIELGMVRGGHVPDSGWLHRSVRGYLNSNEAAVVLRIADECGGRIALHVHEVHGHRIMVDFTLQDEAERFRDALVVEFGNREVYGLLAFYHLPCPVFP